MSGRIIRRAESYRDLVDHFVRIAERSLPTADRFLIAAEEAFAFLANMPEIGALWEPVSEEFKGLRVWQIRGFENHLIFYRPIPHGVEIIRVLFGGRDLRALFR